MPLHFLALHLLARRLAARHAGRRSRARHVRPLGVWTASLRGATVGPSPRAGLLPLPTVLTTALGTTAVGAPPTRRTVLLVAAGPGLGENEEPLILPACEIERRCRGAQDRHGHHRAGEQS
ncbi:hypothetical protein ACFQU1_13680 [Chelatococcus sp. GCM10030263]|uniref:hypothetical protein n=1 Tax=Chelatococcus sp. GCM10030263 TaxID=3273387 RepID=UPI0036134A52